MNKNLQDYIKFLNEYYDCINAIIIERTAEFRLPKLKESLNGLNYRIVNGVDGKRLNKEEKEKMYDHDGSVKALNEYHLFRYGEEYNVGLTDGNIGCSATHLNIYKDMLDKGYKKVLILEDDARTEWKYVKYIPEILHQMPENCDIFYWGYRWYDSESMLHRFKRKYFRTLLNIAGGRDYKKILEEDKVRYPQRMKSHIWRSGFHAGTHAYAVNRNAAEKIILVNTPIRYAADAAISSLVTNGTLNAFVAVPMIFRNDQNLASTILEKQI